MAYYFDDQINRWVSKDVRPEKPAIPTKRKITRLRLESASRRRPSEGMQELLTLLESIEEQRSELQDHSRKLTCLLQKNPSLRKQWDEFLQAGGVTVNDLRRWLKGEQIGQHTTIKRKRHLRLIDREPMPSAA